MLVTPIVVAVARNRRHMKSNWPFGSLAGNASKQEVPSRNASASIAEMAAEMMTRVSPRAGTAVDDKDAVELDGMKVPVPLRPVPDSLFEKPADSGSNARTRATGMPDAATASAYGRGSAASGSESRPPGGSSVVDRTMCATPAQAAALMEASAEDTCGSNAARRLVSTSRGLGGPVVIICAELAAEAPFGLEALAK
jgi:hypothetical protein